MTNKKTDIDDILIEPENKSEGENYIDYENREMLLDGVIDEDAIQRYVMPIIMINKCDDMEGLEIIERTPITIYINCLGGDLGNGFALMDVICSSKTPIIGVVLGYAYSMALPILLSCHERYCYPNSMMLLHDGEVTLNNSGSKIKDQYDFITKQENRLRNFILKNSKITEKQLEKNWRNEWFMDSETALSLGIVDKIIDYII